MMMCTHDAANDTVAQAEDLGVALADVIHTLGQVRLCRSTKHFGEEWALRKSAGRQHEIGRTFQVAEEEE